MNTSFRSKWLNLKNKEKCTKVLLYMDGLLSCFLDTITALPQFPRFYDVINIKMNIK